MITAFTGTPGSGKTHEAVRYMRDIMLREPTRPLFVHGIPELKIPHTQVYCRSLDCDICSAESLTVPAQLFTEQNGLYECINRAEIDAAQKRIDDVLYVDEWHVWAKDKPGALLFLDEVQRFWRPRPSGSKVPPHISMLETHRHYGLDFIIVTQSPTLIDANVRKLVSKHLHLLRKWDGNHCYEWSECKDNTGAKSGAIRTKYKLRKDIFELYKSASLHTKIQKTIPMVVYVFPVLLLIAIALITITYQKLHSPDNWLDKPQQNPSAISSPVPTVQPQPTSLTNVVNSSALPDKNTFDSIAFDFTPRIVGIPSTAPAYDHLSKLATSYPRIDHCVSHTQQILPDGWHYEANPLPSYRIDPASYLNYAALSPTSKERKRIDKLLEPEDPYYFSDSKPNKHYKKPPSSTHYEYHCDCYTQQHTPYQTTEDFCRAKVLGKVFDPYKQDAQNNIAAVSSH